MQDHGLRYNMVMLIEFFRWWYGPGWLEAWHKAFTGVTSTQRAFSVGVLLTTLFSPWKQIVSLPGRSLEEKFRAMVDNLLSRIIGFFARLCALFMAVVLMLLAGIVGVAMAVSWPLLPLVVAYFLFRSLAG